MSNRQTKKYIITSLNGVDIEAIGTANMKMMTEWLSGYKLKVRYIQPKEKDKDKKKEPEIVQESL